MDEEINLKDILVVIKSNLPIIVGCAVLGIIIGIAICLLSKPLYEAKADIFVYCRGWEGKGGTDISERMKSNLSQLFLSSQIIEKMIKSLNLPYSEKVAKDIISRIKVKVTGDVINVRLRSSISSKDALDKLKALIEVFFEDIQASIREVMSSEVELYGKQLKSLEDEIVSLKTQIKKLREKGGIFDFSKQKHEALTRITELELENTKLNSEIESKTAGLNSLEKKLSGLGINAIEVPEEMDKLRDIETKILSATDDEQKKELQRKLQALKDEIDSKIFSALRLRIHMLSEFERSLAKEFIKLKMELKSLVARRDVIEKKIEEEKKHLHVIQEEEFKISKLEKELADKEQEYKAVFGAFTNANLSAMAESVNAKIITPPFGEDRPVAPKKKLVLALSTFCGLFIGFFVSILKFSFTRPFLSVEEFSKEYPNLTVLAKIPKSRFINSSSLIEDIVTSKKFTVLKESIEELKNNISLSYNFDFPIVFGISSSVAAEGKSTISALLALSYARERKRTLLVDFDVRKSSLRRLFGISPPSYVGEKEFVTYKPNSVENMDVIVVSAKEISFPEMLAWMKGELDIFKRKFDVIIFDTPPRILPEKVIMFKELSLDLVLVLDLTSTPKSIFKETVETVKNRGINVTGVVVNKVDTLLYYPYYRYYKYYS